MPYVRMMTSAAFVVFALMSLTGALPALGATPDGPASAYEVAVPHDRTFTEPEFLEWFRGTRGLPESSDLRRERNGPSKMPGWTYSHYAHVWEGVRVADEGLSVHLKDDIVVSAFGRVTVDVAAVTVPSLSEPEAHAAAVKAVAGVLRARSVTLAPTSPRPCTLSLELSAAPSTEYALQYECWVITRSPAAQYLVAVDAIGGTTVRLRSSLVQAWEPALGSGLTNYNGTVGPFEVEWDNPGTGGSGEFRLRGGGVHTRDADGATEHDLPVAKEYLNATATFGPPAAPGVSVHWGVQQARSYAQVAFGDDLLSGKVELPVVEVFANVASSIGSHFDPFFRWLVFTLWPAHDTEIDTVGHETGHMLMWQKHAMNLSPSMYRGEYASLHESFADIFGQLLEEYAVGSSDWILGANYPGPGQRSLVNPLSTGQPDVYGGINWVNPASSTDNGGAHVNDSLQNLWFHRLAFGGQGVNSASTAYAVKGVGVRTARATLYLTMAEKLKGLASSTGAYVVARDASIASAKDLCGEFSQLRFSVHNAWHSVGVQPAPLNSWPYMVPANGATAVTPWGLKLQWQSIHFRIESSWVVEVSTDPTFETDVSAFVSEDTAYENGYHVGILTTTLLPSTTYHWRVRKLYGDETLDCWRPVATFTTGSATPIAYWPTGSNLHPWVMNFSWSSVPGAEDYQIEVAEDIGFTKPIFPTQTIPAKPAEPDQTARITVLKKKELYWRVRARTTHQGQLIESAPSTPKAFTTNEPQVTLLGPAHGSYNYPWPMFFTWSYLAGAEFFFYNAGLNGFTSWPNPFTTTNNWRMIYPYVYDAWKADNKGVEWWVKPYGPPLGSELTPLGEDTREWGKASPKWNAYIDGDPTQVQITQPVPANPPNLCVKYGESVNVSWPAISGATQYDLREGLIVQCTNGSCSCNIEFGSPFPETTGTSAVVQTAHRYNLPPHGTAAGVCLKVMAEHEDSDGVGPSVPLMVSVRPTKPQITAIYPDAIDAGEVDFDWVTDFAFEDDFEVTAWEGSSCSGSVVVNGVINIEPDEPGGSVYGASLHNMDDGDYSMRLRSIDNPVCGQPAPWSDCVPFNYVAPAPPPPAVPSVVTGAFGSIGYLVAIFTVSQGATSYEIEVRLDNPGGALVGTFAPSVGELMQAKAAVEQWAQTPLPNSHWFAPIQGTTALQTYVFKVKACNAEAGCSDWSDWGEWNEFFPWPF